MPYAKLTLTIPESVWIGELSRAHPGTKFRVLAATANTATGVARLEIHGPEPAAVCREMQNYESVTDLTVFGTDDDAEQVQVETTVPLVVSSLQDSGVPLELPVMVSDGELTLESTIPQDGLSALGDALDAVGISYTVERIQQEVESDPLLTERQRRVLDEAIEQGYYDTPRRTTLVDLAADLDIAKSTCSEILHRAEEHVLKAYRSEEYDDIPDVGVTVDHPTPL